MNYPNPRHLKAFVQVVRMGSFAKAAQSLHIGQPALSQAIANLERLAGVSLLRRTTRQLTLTPAGEVFHHNALRVLEENERLTRHAKDWSSAQTGKLVLLSVPSVASLLLPVVVREFKRWHPQVTVQVHDHADPELRRRFSKGEGDLAIMTQQASDPLSDCVPLLRDPLYVLALKNHPLAPLEKIKVQDLKNQQLILLRPGSVVRDMAEPLLKKIKSPLPYIEVDQLGTLLGMVSAGMGMSLIPALSLLPALANHFMHRPVANAELSRDVSFIKPRDRALMPSATAFIDLFVNCVRQQRIVLPKGVVFLDSAALPER